MKLFKSDARSKAYFWPELLYQSLSRASRSKIPPAKLGKLNEANQKIWEALNVFDDFLDGEGCADLLPGALFKYRSFISFFRKLNLGCYFENTTETILSDLDKANYLELKTGRLTIKNGRISHPAKLPAPKPLIKLADKSLALALGPLAALYLAGPEFKMQPKKILLFFRLSLAAKQLSDDARDWHEDLMTGKLTEANRPIIVNSDQELDLDDQSGKPFILFTNYAAPTIIRNLGLLCSRARQAGVAGGLAISNPLAKSILEPIEKNLNKAINFRRTLDKKVGMAQQING